MRTGQRTKYEVATVGKAAVANSRMNFFTDLHWEERFDILIRLSQRTGLIMEMTGINIRPQRLKAAVAKRLIEMGVKVNRPRGIGKTYNAKGFLPKMRDKYDAAYLLGLHFGANGPGSSAIVETNLGAALDKRLEVYLRYVSDLYERQEDACVCFETYIVLIEGIKKNEVPMHTCKQCSSFYVWPVGSYMHHSCPVCAVHQHDVNSSREKLEILFSGQKFKAMPATLGCYK